MKYTPYSISSLTSVNSTKRFAYCSHKLCLSSLKDCSSLSQNLEPLKALLTKIKPLVSAINYS